VKVSNLTRSRLAILLKLSFCLNIWLGNFDRYRGGSIKVLEICVSFIYSDILAI